MEKVFLQIERQTGVQQVALPLRSGHQFNVRMSMPKQGENEGRYPLVISLHWAGSGNTFIEHAECLVEPGVAAWNPIVISPDAEGQTWNTPESVEKVIALTKLAMKHWPIDDSRVIVVGYSNGGNGSWFFADEYSNLFTASIPIASAYLPQRKIKIPIYVIHGAEDELFDISRTLKWVNLAKKRGSNIGWKSIPKFSHFMGCAYLAELKKGLEWVEEELTK